MPVSTYLNEQLLNHILRGNIISTSFTQPTEVWLGLHKADPTGAGDTTTELTPSSGGYGRVLVTFSVFSGDYVSNNAQVQFLTLPSVPTGIKFWSLWDAETDGNMLFYEQFEDTTVINSGDTFTITSGTLKVKFEDSA